MNKEKLKKLIIESSIKTDLKIRLLDLLTEPTKVDKLIKEILQRLDK